MAAATLEAPVERPQNAIKVAWGSARKDVYEQYLFHGVGCDISKLMMILSNGILCRSLGESHVGFTQEWGIGEGKASGGINGADWISSSSYGSSTFQSFHGAAITLLLKRSDLVAQGVGV